MTETDSGASVALFTSREEPSDMAWLATSIAHRRLSSFLAALGDPTGPNLSPEFGFRQRQRISEIALWHFDGLLGEIDDFVCNWFDGMPRPEAEPKPATKKRRTSRETAGGG